MSLVAGSAAHPSAGPRASLLDCSVEDFPRACGKGGVPMNSVQFVNKCRLGTPSLLQSNGQILSGLSANLSGQFVRGVGFLDQGSCGSAPNLNCTSVEIHLGGTENNGSYIRILRTRFSVPVSFVFSEGCSLSGQCLKQTCPPQFLECRARDASAVVTFCPTPLRLLPPPSSTPRPISSTTSPVSAARTSLSPLEVPSSTTRRFLHTRERSTDQLLGAELGGAFGGAAFLLLIFIGFVCIRRRRARQIEARLPQHQAPFVVNPTWVLASPTTPEGTLSHLSLPDRARPRTVPIVAHQMSMPNLATQYRMRVLRPRASTVGSFLARTETRGSREQSDTGVGVGPTPSESSVWRPRIDILGARQQRTEGSTTGQPQTPMDSFWAE